MTRAIVYLVETLGSLDNSFQFSLLANALAESKNWQVHIAVINSSLTNSTLLADSDVKIHLLSENLNSPGRKLTTLLTVAKSLQRLLKKVQPEVVHTWGAEATRCMGLAEELLKSRDSRARWISTLDHKPEKSSFIANGIDRRFRRGIEKVFVPHDCLRQPMWNIGLEPYKVFEIPPGAASSAPRDTARDKLLQQMGLTGRPAVVAATVADLIPATRVKDLIWATDLLNCIRDDFHLVIFGSGHQRENLQRFARFTEAASHIHFFSPAEAAKLLAGIDVYWHSHLRYPSSSALLSAMASAVPVISVYGAGTEEIILHQQTGFAVNYGARDEFARWTKFLIEKPDAARQLAQQGRTHAINTFPVEKMVSTYLSAYQNNR